jgi:hypothetical protein
MWGVTPIKDPEDLQNKRRKKLLSISFFLFFFWQLCCDVELLKACRPYSLSSMRRQVRRSLNLCHREAHMRDCNKVSGQCICATTRSCSTMIRAATRILGIVYIDGVLHLLCANHPSADKSQRWAHNSPSSNGLDSPSVCVSSSEHLWNLPQTKIWI